jgi:hypothetical protein
MTSQGNTRTIAAAMGLMQIAPDPLPLRELVARLRYKPAWTFSLEDVDRGQGSSGLTLSIYIAGPDTDDHSRTVRVVHYMPVPPAAFNERSWRRWLFEQILLVERHEAAEWYRIDGEQPFRPLHGPGHDPYMITEIATDIERRTDFPGRVREDND